MEKGVIVSVLVIDVMLFLIYYFGQSYIGEVIELMKCCERFGEDWDRMMAEMPRCNPVCMTQRLNRN